MASKLNVEGFVSDFEAKPSESKLDKLKRSELFEVAKYYNVSVVSSMKKADLKAVLVEFFIDEEFLKEPVEKLATSSVISNYCEETVIKLKELELQKVQAELEIAKLKYAQPEAWSSSQSKHFDPSKHIRLVPRFQDKDVDKYFSHFEKVAERLSWPSDMRTLLLQSVLTGKAQEVYSALPVEQSSDYKLVKAAILKAYEQVPEAYRQKFRTKKKTESQSYIEFSRDKENL